MFSLEDRCKFMSELKDLVNLKCTVKSIEFPKTMTIISNYIWISNELLMQNLL